MTPHSIAPKAVQLPNLLVILSGGGFTFETQLLLDHLRQHADFTYDARGNLLERLDNGKIARFTWDLYDRLTRYEDDRLTADFAYDALGRRVAKYSKAHCPPSPGAGPAWIEQQQRTLNAQYDCGQNIYGWDGDTLAYETRYSDNPGERRLIHYFYEPGSFVPVAQTVENRSLSLVREPSHENGYHIDRDPLWQHQPVAKPFNAIAWYQCDHLGTPMELTDQRGEIAWSATYQAWGLVKEKRTDSGCSAARFRCRSTALESAAGCGCSRVLRCRYASLWPTPTLDTSHSRQSRRVGR